MDEGKYTSITEEYSHVEYAFSCSSVKFTCVDRRPIVKILIRAQRQDDRRKKKGFSVDGVPFKRS